MPTNSISKMTPQIIAPSMFLKMSIGLWIIMNINGKVLRIVNIAGIQFL
jgi:hypothetical protein